MDAVMSDSAAKVKAEMPCMNMRAPVLARLSGCETQTSGRGAASRHYAGDQAHTRFECAKCDRASHRIVGTARDYGHCAFFFSSRRRHTRFKCDWSSDVCSSD